MGKKISVDMSWVLKECEATNKERQYYLTRKSGYIDAIGNQKKQNIQSHLLTMMERKFIWKR